MERAEGYKQLVQRFGEGAVADRLLAKWVADPDADEKWERLDAAVKVTNGVASDPRARVYKYWVILWKISLGWKEPALAEEMGVSIWTIKREVWYARRTLGLVGKPLPVVVATAIRQGHIP